LTNLDEYLAGTYPRENADGYNLEFVTVAAGIAHLRFLAITGRTYHITHSTDLQQPFVPRDFSVDPSAQNRTAFHLASVRKLTSCTANSTVNTPNGMTTGRKLSR
jgi:hypothetical protein